MDQRLLIVLLLILKHVSTHCNVFVNELNVIDPQKPEKAEFIELKTDCKDLALRGYKVIGLTSGNKKNTKASITFVATLWNERFKGEFYTIGGVNIDKADMKISSGLVKFRESWNKNKQMSMTNFLTNENTNLNAIGILYKKNDAISAIQLDKNKNVIPLDEQLTKFLNENLIDLVIYSGKCDSDSCDIFEILHPAFAKRKYVIRDFDFKQDLTLNRCTIETDGFIPEKFKLGKPTPGTENDCSGTHFILEDRLQQVLPSFISSPEHLRNDVSNFDDSCVSTSTAMNEDLFSSHSMSIENYVVNANAEAATDTCTSLQLYPDSGNLAEELDHGNVRKRRLSNEDDYSEELEWQTEKHFEYVFV